MLLFIGEQIVERFEIVPFLVAVMGGGLQNSRRHGRKRALQGVSTAMRSVVVRGLRHVLYSGRGRPHDSFGAFGTRVGGPVARSRARAAARRATVSGTRASRASRSRIFCGDDHDSALGARVGARCPRARAWRTQGRRRGPRGARARGLRRGHGASRLACALRRIGKEGRRPEMHLRRKRPEIFGRFHA